MFRLAGPAWVIDISEPFRDPASLKTRFAGFFRAVLKRGKWLGVGGQHTGKCLESARVFAALSAVHVE